MDYKKQFTAFIESICNQYGKPEAIQPLVEGFNSLLEMEMTVPADKIDDYTFSFETDAEPTFNEMAVKEMYDNFDRDLANAKGMDFAFQMARAAAIASGFSEDELPADDSEYIAAYGSSIADDEQPWTQADFNCVTKKDNALQESHFDRTTGNNWFGKTLRDQHNYDRLRGWGRKGDDTDTKTMSKTDSRYGYISDGVKGMGLSGKFGDAWALNGDGFNDTDVNSDISKNARRQMKRKENVFWNKDIQSQLDDMMTTDADELPNTYVPADQEDWEAAQAHSEPTGLVDVAEIKQDKKKASDLARALNYMVRYMQTGERGVSEYGQTVSSASHPTMQLDDGFDFLSESKTLLDKWLKAQSVIEETLDTNASQSVLEKLKALILQFIRFFQNQLDSLKTAATTV
jgi:hypothetical protein